ncbi:MAG: L-2-amino-thiazoline-4-carboxylic acid hydrolase [Deltaproteobacteria bacterium]|nr:L-2-amino-thiazoline-4-carboxylic acid hydrolase [Deltaproteobacteria bacterium]
MAQDINQVNLLTRREIEARTAGPLIEQFIEAMGKDKALAEVDKVVQRLAGEAGAQMAQTLGGNTMEHFHKAPDMWKQGGALEIELEEMDKDKLVFKVTRCRYAEMYRELGYEELGQVLSCGRDAAFAQGFNPGIRMTRTQTIMSGGSHCDFKFELVR